jgi:hypothetical protein
MAGVGEFAQVKVLSGNRKVICSNNSVALWSLCLFWAQQTHKFAEKNVGKYQEGKRKLKLFKLIYLNVFRSVNSVAK